MRWVCGFAFVVLFMSPAMAHAPDAHWKTIQTQHFRVHYPVAHEVWARQAAAKLETVRDLVGEAVGYRPQEITDVIISDPVAEANGFAWPVLGWPRMVLWTNPPGPSSIIGHYRNWPELLLVHEQTHLAHLLRPSRNPMRRMFSRIFPLGPIIGAPRWITEGYATLIEGQKEERQLLKRTGFELLTTFHNAGSGNDVELWFRHGEKEEEEDDFFDYEE